MKGFIYLIAFIFSVTAYSSQELERAKSLNNRENYTDAATLLYGILKNSRYKSEHAEISFEMAKSLEGMGLKHSAIYQLMNASRTAKGKVLEETLSHLSRLAFEVGDYESLEYAIPRINIKRIPKSQRPIVYFIFGEAYLRAKKYKKSIFAFSKIPSGHFLYTRAQYFLGLALAENNSLSQSYTAYTRAANSRAGFGVTDEQRVAALMGRARVLYQMRKWGDSLAAYRIIPRDSVYFHDMLFESAWAMLRGGKFRSALSNFQSLHSIYYEDYYYPEAALLRAIVYLYICKIDEVNKVIDFYEKTYGSFYKKLDQYLKSHPSPKSDIEEFVKLVNLLENDKKISSQEKEAFAIPYVLLRDINRNTQIKSYFNYYKSINSEVSKISKMGSIGNSSLGNYLLSALNKREKIGLVRLGRSIRRELMRYNQELLSYGDQKELIKFELISSEKEEARKRLEARDDFSELDKGKDKKTTRFDFTKNGYEYWPFQGEYWLDEIGNYHYLGASRCE